VVSEFLLLATVNAFAVASPGADFAVVVRNTLRGGKSIGVATATGIGLGLLVHITYTLLGVAFILAKSDLIFITIKYLGASYLLWLAFKSFQSKKVKSNLSSEQPHIEMTTAQAIKQGFVVNVLNPKVTLFFVAIFTTTVSSKTSIGIQALYGVWICVYAALWFSLVAWSFSRQVILKWYQEHGHFIDWGMGCILVLIAARLIFS